MSGSCETLDTNQTPASPGNARNFGRELNIAPKVSDIRDFSLQLHDFQHCDRAGSELMVTKHLIIRKIQAHGGNSRVGRFLASLPEDGLLSAA
jgi:hypothetical protein